MSDTAEAKNSQQEQQGQGHTPEPTPVEPAPTAVENISLSEEQAEFIAAVLEKTDSSDSQNSPDPNSPNLKNSNAPNILLLGKAGVGKSTATREACRAADEQGLSYILCAPTGVAAINIGGQTVHRLLSSLDRGYIPAHALYNLHFLLIDEVSMLRADLFDKLNQALQRATLDTRPFGGVRIVLVGDPGQLPPVVKRGDDEAEYIKHNYFTPYFFSAACYSQSNWQVIELTKVFRQKEARFPKLLNLVREGKSKKPVAYLNKFRKTQVGKGVVLTSRNKDAEVMNAIELGKLPGEEYTYRAQIQGQFKSSEYPADEILRLKAGARAMCIKNIYESLGTEPGSASRLVMVNGDIVEVLECSESSVLVRCQRTGEEVRLSPEDGVWEKQSAKYNKETKRLERKSDGSFTQIPLRLAWAITIHKSQGATIEELTIDLRKPLFAPGQAYVALSRGVSLDSLWIMGRLRETDVQVCPDVAAFLDDHSSGVGIKPGSEWEELQKQAGKEVDSEKEREAFDELFGG